MGQVPAQSCRVGHRALLLLGRTLSTLASPPLVGRRNASQYKQNCFCRTAGSDEEKRARARDRRGRGSVAGGRRKKGGVERERRFYPRLARLIVTVARRAADGCWAPRRQGIRRGAIRACEGAARSADAHTLDCGPPHANRHKWRGILVSPAPWTAQAAGALTGINP